MSDQVLVHCPHCNQRYQLKAPQQDKHYSCKKCKGVFLIEADDCRLDQDEANNESVGQVSISLPAEEPPIIAEVRPSPATAEAGVRPQSQPVNAPVFSFSTADLANAFVSNVSGSASVSAMNQTPNTAGLENPLDASDAPEVQALGSLNVDQRPKTKTTSYLPFIVIGGIAGGVIALIVGVVLWVIFQSTQTVAKTVPKQVPVRPIPAPEQRPMPAGQFVDPVGQQPMQREDLGQEAKGALENAEPDREQKQRQRPADPIRPATDRKEDKPDKPKEFVASELLPNLKPNQITAEFGELGWGVRSLGFSPEGTLYAGKNDNAMLALDVEKGRILDQAEKVGSSGEVSFVVVTPDGKTLLSAEYSGVIHVWDLGPDRVPRKRGSYRGHGEQLLSIRLSQDGSMVASGSSRGDFRVWDLATLEDVATFQLKRMRLHASYLSPDNKIAMVTNGEEMVKFDLVARQEISRTKVTSGYAQCVAFSPDGKTLVVPYSYDLKIIDVESSKHIRTLKGPRYSIFSVAFSPDGKHVFAGGGRVLQWDWQAGKLLNEYQVARSSTVKAIALSADGKQMAVAHEPLSKAVRVFRVRNDSGEGAN